MNKELIPEPPLKYKLGPQDELEEYLNQHHICAFCYIDYGRRWMKDHFKQKTHNKILKNRLEFEYNRKGYDFDRTKFLNRLKQQDDIDFVEKDNDNQ